MIVEIALNLLRKSDEIQAYLRDRFRWFVIDEYQDLGASMHTFTTFIVDTLQVNVLAVGDPNQSIYESNQVEESYISSLQSKESFSEAIETTKCYRFGDRLIAASLSIIRKNLNYVGASKYGAGEIHFHKFNTLEDQCNWVVSTLVPNLYQLTDNPSNIAILYRQRGAIPNEIRRSIKDKSINQDELEYADERNNELPDSPIIKWLRQCADWSLMYHRQDTDSLNKFPELFNSYLSLLKSAKEKPSQNDEFQLELDLLNTLSSFSKTDIKATEWLEEVCRALRIQNLLRLAGNRTGELEDLDDLITRQTIGIKLEQITLKTDPRKVVLTTMHSSKGREFDYVILPGTQNLIMPWSGPENLDSSRRLFYVACTRAKKAVYIIYSNSTEILMPWGRTQICALSPFISDMKSTLSRLDKFPELVN
ncbi:MAG: ATP-dependent helicase [Anaerolineae bacterium]|nr:ATP-dependent helicase [Anaerolineae bacterium]